MAKILELTLEDEEQLCKLGSALSSPARIQILKLLYFNSFNVGELAEKLNIPASSAALYVRSLENAGLINTRVQQGSRGSMKICSRRHDDIHVRLTAEDNTVPRTHSISMPIGCYTDCCITPTCGLASEHGPIGPDDQPSTFYLPGHVNAQLLWSSSGYVEYKFPCQIPEGRTLRKLNLSFEACSEAFNYKENWPSDITIWLDGIDCGTWRCPGDFGERFGRLNPDWWYAGSTQYGRLVTLEISESGTTINAEPASNVTIHDLHFSSSKPITVRIGNKPDAEYIGGFNLFGEKFGDIEQNIIMDFMY